jgi:acyl-CoA thioesterase
MPGLGTALAAVARDGDHFATIAPEGWTTGRTVYGGMTAALAARAVSLEIPGLPPLRSAQFVFIGPAAGELQLRVDLLRQGSSSVVVSVDCHAEGKLASRSLVTYGADRESVIRHKDAPMPEVPAPALCEPFMANAPAAGFFQYFDHRLAGGARPFTPNAAPTSLVWIRLLDTKDVDPLSALLTIADAVPPAAMVTFPDRGPISTMTWSIDVVQPVETTEWLLVQSTSEIAASGYSQQAMNVWNANGDRLAACRQTVALFV